MNKIRAFIVDLDGTIALHTKEERGHFEYDKVLFDKPNIPVIGLVRLLVHYPYMGSDLVPLSVTGRPDVDDVRLDTEEWLRYHVGIGPLLSDPQPLFMRPGFLKDDPEKRDYRKDFEVKEEIYREQIEPFYDVKFAIDDRPQVLKMWHRIGIPTLAVGTPWIDF